MGMMKKLRLSGVTVIPERVKSKFAGNKKARFRGSVSRWVTKLKKSKIIVFLSGKIKRVRKDREVSARRVTKAEKYATDIMLNGKVLSDAKMERLYNQANPELELAHIQAMLKNQDKVKETLQKMAEGVENKIKQDLERTAQALQASKAAIAKANSEGFKNSYSSAMSGDCSALTKVEAERQVVNEFKKLFYNNGGKIPSKQIILKHIEKMLAEKEPLFEENLKNMQDWKSEVTGSETLVKKDQDRMNSLVANIKLEAKIKSYKEGLEQEGENDSPEIFTFFSTYSDELGIGSSEHKDNNVPDRYSFLRTDSIGKPANNNNGGQDENAVYQPTHAKQD